MKRVQSTDVLSETEQRGLGTADYCLTLPFVVRLSLLAHCAKVYFKMVRLTTSVTFAFL